MSRDTARLENMRPLIEDDSVELAQEGSWHPEPEILSDAEFERLYVELFPALIRFLGARVNEVTAEDVAQDAFVQAYDHLSKFNVGTNFGSWVFRIAQNRYIDTWKKNNRVDFTDPGLLPDTSDSTEEIVEQLSAIEDVRIALGKLSEPDQDILLKVGFNGQSHLDYAADNSISVHAAEVRLYRARSRLKKLLTQDTTQE